MTNREQKRNPQKPFGRQPSYDPTPQEIEAAKEDIQQGWTEELECQRRVGLAPTLDISKAVAQANFLSRIGR